MELKKLSNDELEVTDSQKEIVTREELEAKKASAETILIWVNQYLDVLNQ